MSVADSKHSVIPMTKSLPLSVVSSFYRHHPTCAGGFSSPSQVYSPAPVRSGKTPMSPMAPLDPQYSFLTEQSDDDDNDDGYHEWQCSSRCDRDEKPVSHTGNHTTSRHPLYDVQCTRLVTRQPDDEKLNHSHARSPIESTSLIAPLNLNVLENRNHPANTTRVAHEADRFDESADFGTHRTTTASFHTCNNRITKSQSVMDFDPRQDEEFKFRMHAEPFSLARDSVATSTVCVSVVCDDPGHVAEGTTTAVLLSSEPIDQPVHVPVAPESSNSAVHQEQKYHETGTEVPSET